MVGMGETKSIHAATQPSQPMTSTSSESAAAHAVALSGGGDAMAGGRSALGLAELIAGSSGEPRRAEASPRARGILHTTTNPLARAVLLQWLELASVTCESGSICFAFSCSEGVSYRGNFERRMADDTAMPTQAGMLLAVASAGDSPLPHWAALLPNTTLKPNAGLPTPEGVEHSTVYRASPAFVKASSGARTKFIGCMWGCMWRCMWGSASLIGFPE